MRDRICCKGVTAARVLSLKLRIFYLDLCCLDARSLFRFLYLL
jgi:hypothetical protein